MNVELTGIVRDMVVSFLCAEKPPLTLRSSVNPADKAESINVFYGQYSLVSKRLFFFPFGLFSSDFIEKPEIYIYFFYKGTELYIEGPVKRVKNGFAFVIPHTIFKKADVPSVYLRDLSAKIYLPGFKTAHAECRLAQGYTPFDNRLWLSFSENEILHSRHMLESIASLKPVELPVVCKKLLAKTKRILYLPGKKIPSRNFFPFPVSVTTDDVENEDFERLDFEIESLDYDVYIPLTHGEDGEISHIFAFKSHKPMSSPLEIEEKLFLLPICRFLSTAHAQSRGRWGRVEPLSVLCITHSRIILGGCGTSASSVLSNDSQNAPFALPLTEGGEYLICIRVLLGSVCRVLKMNIAVSKIYSTAGGCFCASCLFSRIQEEDRRFLYEKFYGILYK
ncbi:hypothetical protein H0R92_10070 [Treponema sp. OMZ 840]|uniref:hypothetical protein n=1 Tax=Treponema sp. OMZ 840 TaxID=244313 RepID=UPI003D8BEA03